MKTYLTANHFRLVGTTSEIRNQLSRLIDHPTVSQMSLRQYLSAVSMGDSRFRRVKNK